MIVTYIIGNISVAELSQVTRMHCTELVEACLCMYVSIYFKTLNLFPTVASDPFNITLTQTSATSVIVEWSQPSGGATVTGYVVE